MYIDINSQSHLEGGKASWWSTSLGQRTKEKEGGGGEEEEDEEEGEEEKEKTKEGEEKKVKKEEEEQKVKKKKVDKSCLSRRDRRNQQETKYTKGMHAHTAREN